jgi:hypothetical protein
VESTLDAPVPKQRRRFRIVAILLVAGAVLALCWRVFFLGETFCQGDLSGYYRPAKWLLAPLARSSGGVPVWNPFFGSGQPFAGNPEHEVFHPLTSLFFLLPFELAFVLQVTVPLLIAVVSMHVLLRTLGRSPWASLMGALAWAFGGYLLSSTTLLPTLFGASVIPLALVFVARLLRGDDGRDVVGLALCVAWQCLAGEPSILLVTALPYAALIAHERRHFTLTALFRIAGGIALGMSIGAVTLIPGIDHVSKTIRAAGLPEAWASLWSMPPLRALDLISPNALGHPETLGGYWGLSWYAPRPGPLLASFYPGLLVTALAVAAFRLRWRRLWPWIALAAIGFLLALGRFFPLWPLLRRLPLASAVRFPEKFALLLVLPVVVVAAYGFDLVLRGPRRQRRVMAILLATLGAAGVLLAMLLWLARAAFDHAGVMAGDALRVAVVALSLATLFVLRRRLRYPLLAPIFVVALAIDVVTAGRAVLPTCEPSDLNTPPAFLRELASSARNETIFHWAAWLPGVRTAMGTQGMAKPPIPAQWGLAMTLESDFDLTQLRWTWEATDRFWGVVHQDRQMALPLLRRRGVTAVVQAGSGGSGPAATVFVGNQPIPIEAVPIADSRPFVFAARRVEIVDGNDGWETTVMRLRDEAAGAACVDRSSLDSFPGTPAPAEIGAVERSPDRLSLRVLARGPQPSFLAINQTWDPFWEATMDGAPAQLLRTDISLSGLVVPAGPHTIVLAYHNPWLDLGMATSAFGLLAALALLVLRVVRAGRRGPEPGRGAEARE